MSFLTRVFRRQAHFIFALVHFWSVKHDHPFVKPLCCKKKQPLPTLKEESGSGASKPEVEGKTGEKVRRIDFSYYHKWSSLFFRKIQWQWKVKNCLEPP